MSNIADLKNHVNTKTLNLVLLSIATVGIYPLMWLFRYVPTLESVTQKPIANNAFLIWMAVCIGLGAGLSGSGEEDLEAIAGLITIAGYILYIVLAFKMKAALEAYAAQHIGTEIKLNPILTFGCTIYYINYQINKLAEAPLASTASPSAQ